MRILKRAKRSRVMDALYQMDKALDGLSDKEKLQAIMLLQRAFEIEMLNKTKADCSKCV